MAFLNRQLSMAAILLVNLYQQLFVAYRQHARCKYFPSCSGYMILAIKKRGLCIGAVKGVWRILRCHPFAQGGVDLP